MAIGPASAPRNRFGSLLDALFGEAWRLARRRRRRWWLHAVIACAITASAVLTVGGGGSAIRVGSPALARVSVASHALPALGQSPTLSVERGRLIVADNGNMRVVGGRVLGTCTAATIEPRTLRVVSVARGNCGDPQLYGKHVLAVVYQGVRFVSRDWE